MAGEPASWPPGSGPSPCGPFILAASDCAPFSSCPLLALTFWLATEAYRRKKGWLWGMAGFVYGVGFYTYLAFQFTPLLLLLVVLYLVLTGRGRRLWPEALWFLAGTLLALLPMIVLVAQQPDLLFGRSGQVSILNPDVYEDRHSQDIGRQHLGRTGYVRVAWRFNLRHNPAGRPVFDPLLIVPFLIGLAYGACAIGAKRRR